MKEIAKLSKIDSDHPISIPCSKSYLNRALIISSLLNNHTVELQNVLHFGDDVATMIRLLKDLGVEINKSQKESLTVRGIGGKFTKPPIQTLNCGISGTTTRFIIGLSLLFEFDVIITAEGKMLERPVYDLVDAMRNTGAEVDYLTKESTLPIKVHGRKKLLHKGQLSVNGEKSSQILTSILMIAPIVGFKHIHVPGLVSRSYIDITTDIMQEFGVQTLNINYQSFEVSEAKYKRNVPYFVESDWSSASYFFALEFLNQKKLNIAGLNIDSKQGDKNFLAVLHQIQAHQGQHETLTLDMSLMPDTAMTAMIVCALQNFTTTITGLKTLRDKECNRIIAMQTEFAKIGIRTDASQDFSTLTIYGNGNLKLQNTTEIETYHDHRIAMCFAILGTKIGNIQIKDPDVVNKSFPNFWKELSKLYA